MLLTRIRYIDQLFRLRHQISFPPGERKFGKESVKKYPFVSNAFNDNIFLKILTICIVRSVSESKSPILYIFLRLKCYFSCFLGRAYAEKMAHILVNYNWCHWLPNHYVYDENAYLLGIAYSRSQAIFDNF